MASPKVRRLGLRGRWLVMLLLSVRCTGQNESGALPPLQACDRVEERTLAFDEVLTPSALSLNGLAARIGTTVTPGRWLAADGSSELTFELGPLSSAREVSTQTKDGFVCSREIELQSVTIRTSDGGIDVQVPARIRQGDPDALELKVTLPALPEAYLASAVWPPDVKWARVWAAAYDLAPQDGSSPSLVVSFNFDGPSPGVRAAAFEGGDVIGAWDTDARAAPPGPPVPYTPSPPLTSACVGAEAFQGETVEKPSFPTAAAALGALTGTWARCLDHATSDHVGLRILPDGSWQQLGLESGELVARSGFGHEGFLEFHDDSGITGGASSYQAVLLPSGRHYGTPRSDFDDFSTPASERALIFRSVEEGWPAAVYLPTTLPVRAEPPAYAEGERAGAEACEQGEAGIMPTIEQTAATLTGEYVLCSGELRGGVSTIRFGESSLELS